MTSLNTLFSERVQILDGLHAVSQGIATVTGAWIKADRHDRYVVIADVGVMTATATLDLKIQQANTAGGGAAKDVSGKALTQVTQAGSGGSKWYIIELDPAKLDIGNGFFWIATVHQVAAAASLLSLVLLGVDPQYAPVPQTNWSQVK
jgi:hypothetical protein